MKMLSNGVMSKFMLGFLIPVASSPASSSIGGLKLRLRPTAQVDGTATSRKLHTGIFFHHIWKCGGTNICDMAVRNGEVAPKAYDLNPAVRCDATDEQRLFNAPQSNHSFVSWQQPLPKVNFGWFAPSGPLAGFKMVTLLRNPLDQALSHFFHAQRIYELPTMEPNHTLDSFVSFIELGVCAGRQNDTQQASRECAKYMTKEWRDFHHFRVFRDNQQMRWILGADTHNGVGRPMLGAEDLAAAKARLDNFDDVMILEMMHVRDRSRFAKFGWQDLNDLQSANVHRAETNSKSVSATDRLRSATRVLALLRDIQCWDMKFYSYGSNIAARQAYSSMDFNLKINQDMLTEYRRLSSGSFVGSV